MRFSPILQLLSVNIVLIVFWNTVYETPVYDKIFGPPETLPLSRYDDLDVHVYFYFPGSDYLDAKEQYLGLVHGASACGETARSYARGRRLGNNREWSYICCTVEGGSNCYRKIR